MQNFDIQAAAGEAVADKIRSTFFNSRRLSNYWFTRSETLLAEIEALQRRREMALKSHEIYAQHERDALNMWKASGLSPTSLKPTPRKKRTKQTVQEAV